MSIRLRLNELDVQGLDFCILEFDSEPFDPKNTCTAYSTIQ